MRTTTSGSLMVISVLIAGLMGCANSGTGEKTGAYVDDSWITTKVKSTMAADKEVAAHNITVDTSKGVVTLSGTAKSGHESRKAAEIARGIKGVVAVENHISVQ